MTEDEREFGPGAWVYCKSHMRAHEVGWCTVQTSDKTKLEATTHRDAVLECERRGLKLFRFEQKS